MNPTAAGAVRGGRGLSALRSSRQRSPRCFGRAGSPPSET